MHRWLALIFLAGVVLHPSPADAQIPVSLGTVQLQLWPEYDQPSMLVIYDFNLPDNVQPPVNISIRFPAGANLIAVASQAADGNLVNSEYLGPSTNGDWQTVTLHVQTSATYHLEYYQPLVRSGNLRQFSFLWPGDYAIADLTVSVRLPVDTVEMTTTPVMPSFQSADGIQYLKQDFGALTAGQQFALQVNYAKSSEALSASQPNLQPSQPLGASTPGRVMLSNYVPYIIGTLGVALAIGGALYLWQSNRRSGRPREKHARRAEAAGNRRGVDIYCHQCGTRAQHGDRFCRVCGTRLRLPE